MSTDNLSTITSTIPNRAATAVRKPDAQTTESVVSPAGKERQDIAVSGQNLPVNPVSVSDKTENRNDRLGAAVSDINSYVQTINRKLQFSIDESLSLGRAVIKVIDSETDKVIREIPSEEALAIARKISEHFDEKSSVEGLVFADLA